MRRAYIFDFDSGGIRNPRSALEKDPHACEKAHAWYIHVRIMCVCVCGYVCVYYLAGLM